jgi:hypothetical protein
VTVGELIDALAHEDRASEVFAEDLRGLGCSPVIGVLALVTPGEATVVMLDLGL